MRRLAVLTGGGDAPGMNACTRAVQRTATRSGLEVLAIRDGFEGMIRGRFRKLERIDVVNILQRGGTIIGAGRSKDFLTSEGRARAAEQLREHQVDGLVAIGGDGTLRGLHALTMEHGIPIVGVPASIDNDIRGTDEAIGFDTAVNTAVEAVDRLRETADAVGRVFFVEVMGRHCGAIATAAGIAAGAFAVLVPEQHTDLDELARRIQRGFQRGRLSSVVVIAEGNEEGGAFAVAEKVGARMTHEYRVIVLGHVQRGGSPSARDRILATRLGAAAVHAILEGGADVMMGEVGGELRLTPIPEAADPPRQADLSLVNLLDEVTY